jgi:hypothetical protein
MATWISAFIGPQELTILNEWSPTLPNRPGSRRRSVLWLNTDAVIDGALDPLLASQVALRRLD